MPGPCKAHLRATGAVLCRYPYRATPHDQQRFAKLVSEFIDGCGFDPPLYVIAIGSNGAVSVSQHRNSDVKQICGHESYFAGQPSGHPVVV